jgi:hypothetical protein
VQKNATVTRRVPHPSPYKTFGDPIFNFCRQIFSSLDKKFLNILYFNKKKHVNKIELFFVECYFYEIMLPRKLNRLGIRIWENSDEKRQKTIGRRIVESMGAGKSKSGILFGKKFLIKIQ